MQGGNRSGEQSQHAGHPHSFATDMRRAEMGSTGHESAGDHISRDYATDHSDTEAYDMPELVRSTSQTPFAQQSFSLPPGASPGVGATAETLVSDSRLPPSSYGRHSPDWYSQHPPSNLSSAPPSNAASTTDLPKQRHAPLRSVDFTTVPLNDTFSASQSPSRSGSAAPILPQSNQPGPRARSNAATSTVSVDTPGVDEKPVRPRMGRRSSWTELSNEWESFNPAEAKEERLRFAEGDVGKTRLGRLYLWAINTSIVVRWALYIIPVLALLWIPGILGVTAYPNSHIWGVKLLWWSIWLTVVWCGFWASKAVFMIVPHVWKQTIAVIIPSAGRFTDVVKNLGHYGKIIIWSLVSWISFSPLISRRFEGDQESTSRANLNLIANLLFGFFLCSLVWGAEKLVIQLIALQFHRDSYADRLADQKWQFRMLTRLYMNSHDIPGRHDTLDDTSTVRSNAGKKAIRKVLRGVKAAAQSTTNALGNVATEMTGSSVLQTNSPANRVTAALSSANKSRALGRRIYYSFRKPGSDHITIADIARYFSDLEDAELAFSIFDRDGNGDATRDEIDATMLEIHRERLSLEANMRDLDGAVHRLDDILLILVAGICILIISAMITTKVSTFVTSTGTFILSLSWMIGTTMQEILLACIFLFVKHPYDVGDRVDIDGKSYTVAKMELMSTSFKRTDGKFVWIGHNVLALKVIENVRRSGATSESFTFEVAYNTTFDKLQALRVMMLKFCKECSRDFRPVFDVSVDDIPAQGRMVLNADIAYKSNWQQGALKVQRRNKWICHLKMCLADLQIWGPDDAGDPAPPAADPIRYTQIPWEEVREAELNAERSPPPSFSAATEPKLTRRYDSSLDLWGEAYPESDSVAPSRMPSPGPDAAFQIGTPPRRTIPAQQQAQIREMHTAAQQGSQQGEYRLPPRDTSRT
ncbi:hypothetical protein CspeluHIS016_0108010 [Cutaneotrichosporon spelunceum]|uniref:Mechanosensitive ion channel protein n=1 Tax=Cutaneotrichosporon spelunceum TaxID=1672016 RepID=A0AAD3Y8D6_9TREE|nr:hypothetical protein CspeluHIS016_0108010 [Cutaneotrichosporon spelunceum]